MKSKHILKASDQDLVGSFHAMQRAAVFAENKAISTNTNLVVSVGGRASVLSPGEILKLRVCSSPHESDAKADRMPT